MTQTARANLDPNLVIMGVVDLHVGQVENTGVPVYQCCLHTINHRFEAS